MAEQKKKYERKQGIKPGIEETRKHYLEIYNKLQEKELKKEDKKKKKDKIKSGNAIKSGLVK
jgi:hypothetical protein